jgi:hypothetical protein
VLRPHYALYEPIERDCGYGSGKELNGSRIPRRSTEQENERHGYCDNAQLADFYADVEKQ